MIDNKLSAVVQIDGVNYEVTAKRAEVAENAEKLGGTPAADYATKKYVNDADAKKQDKLVSGTSIKTINGQSLLGGGDLAIAGGGASDVASKIKVILEDTTANATITIKSKDPEGGAPGDIWFKY